MSRIRGISPTILVVLCLLVGCSTGRPEVKTEPVEFKETFPKKKELEALEKGERPTSFFDDHRTHVRNWEMEGDLPDEVGVQPMSPETPWERVLRTKTRSMGNGVLATEGMNCLARQLGEFYLEHGAFPSGSVRVFLRTRCGVTTLQFKTFSWT